MVLSSGAIATNAAVRSASGDSFVEGGSKSSSLAMGDSTTSESLGSKSMVPTNAKRFETCKVSQGVLAHVGDESAVVDSVSDDESSSLKTTLGKASTSLIRNLDGFGGIGLS